jgi:hypothetical protein
MRVTMTPGMNIFFGLGGIGMGIYCASLGSIPLLVIMVLCGVVMIGDGVSKLR